MYDFTFEQIEVRIMIAEQEQIERRAVVQSALASQLIEGLEPDATVIEDAEKWMRGEITIAAAVANYKARVRHEMV
jgi:Antitoxin VbhA